MPNCTERCASRPEASTPGRPTSAGCGIWERRMQTNARAESFFRLAIGLDPNFTGGYYGLASAQHQGARLFHTRDLAEAQSSAEALARQAVTLDPADAQAH